MDTFVTLSMAPLDTMRFFLSVTFIAFYYVQHYFMLGSILLKEIREFMAGKPEKPKSAAPHLTISFKGYKLLFKSLYNLLYDIEEWEKDPSIEKKEDYKILVESLKRNQKITKALSLQGIVDFLIKMAFFLMFWPLLSLKVFYDEMVVMFTFPKKVKE